MLKYRLRRFVAIFLAAVVVATILVRLLCLNNDHASSIAKKARLRRARLLARSVLAGNDDDEPGPPRSRPTPIAHRLVIAGIVRDGLPALPRMRRSLEALGDLFLDYRIVIVENDSTDGTVEFLTDWAAENTRVRVDSRRLAELTPDGKLAKRPSHGFLADARNRYLDIITSSFARDYSDFDLLAVVDLDLKRIDLEGFRQSVQAWLDPSSVAAAATPSTSSASEQKVSPPWAREEHVWWRETIRQQQGRQQQQQWWGGLAANGVTQDGHYFDVFALRTEPSLRWDPTDGVLFRTPQGRTLIKQHQTIIDPAEGAFIGVQSAFSGLAVYRTDVIRGCVYSSPHDDCEHVAFHACVAANERGDSRAQREAALAIAPRMLVEYDLACDPGPDIDPTDACFSDLDKAEEIIGFQEERKERRRRRRRETRKVLPI
jgi:hypothetical protein